MMIPLLIALNAAAGAASSPQELGYPRPMSFRTINPEAVRDGWYDNIDLVVSDLHTYVRKDAVQLFKKKFPNRLALLQINMERIGLFGSWESLPVQRFEDLGLLDPAVMAKNTQLETLGDGRYPLPDFLGWWTYDAGDDTLDSIPADTETVTVRVSLPERFLPCTHPATLNALKSLYGKKAYDKEVVICPRNADGKLDWLNAEAGIITALDETNRTVTIRRWKTSKGWPARPEGTYIAVNSVLSYVNLGGDLNVLSRRPGDNILQPWLPNLTEFCPRDPRSGLNAREYLAGWYAGLYRNHYSYLDGMAFDVSVGTFYPSERVSKNADSNGDGVPDGFFFNNINYWPLGMYDFFYTLRHGMPGGFKGVGPDCLLVNDSNHNEDQRFINLLNGAEYEYSMDPIWSMPFTCSSLFDRLLLWGEHAPRPDVTYVNNKNPDPIYHGGDAADLKGVMTLSHWRMDIASACMTSGYAGKDITRTGDGKHPELAQYPAAIEQRKKYGFPVPPDYDEYHEGVRTNFNWLGLPTGQPERIVSQLGPVLYRFDSTNATPSMHAKTPWQAGSVEARKGHFTLGVRQVGFWLSGKDSWNCFGDLPLGSIPFEKDAEYTVSFTVSGSNPWKALAARYANIPTNLRIRFKINGIDAIAFSGFTASYIQEALVFEQPRKCVLTLKAPASGTGSLQFDLSENTGTTTINDLEIRKGCGDVFYRKFQKGLVVLNGSYADPVTVNVASLFPGESYSRIKGTQDAAHNNGEPVAETLTIQPHDAFFLKRADQEEK
jgi:hypothetical protein